MRTWVRAFFPYSPAFPCPRLKERERNKTLHSSVHSLPQFGTMPISEILIVYFAFGAPLAVYRYFDSRKVDGRRRLFTSLATFVFWMPFAVRLLFRHFTNASLEGDFVSPRGQKKSASAANSRQEAVGSAIVEAGCPLPRHDVREVIARYAGLSDAAANNGSHRPGEKAVNFLKAAGRPSDVAAHCLTRRERMRLQKHLTDSRHAFLELFDRLSGDNASRIRAIRRGVELALLLGDIEAAEILGELEYDLEPATHISSAGSISIGRTAATID